MAVVSDVFKWSARAHALASVPLCRPSHPRLEMMGARLAMGLDVPLHSLPSGKLPFT